MRLSVTQDEFVNIKIALKELLRNSKKDEEKQEIDNLLKKLEKQFDKSFETRAKKRNATKKAIEVKKDNTKKKIINAVNLLRLENKKITPYLVAKTSGVSFNTAKKYKYLFQNDISYDLPIL